MRQRQARGEEEQQVELFKALADRPRWSDLHAEVQRTVTELVAQMLRQRRHREVARAAQEVEHE